MFQNEFVSPKGHYELVGYWPRPDENDPTFIHGEVKVRVNGEIKTGSADGNGPISAFVNAINQIVEVDFTVDNYHEQAVGKGADAQAMAYVPLKLADRNSVV